MIMDKFYQYSLSRRHSHHDDEIEWKLLPRNWPFVLAIPRSPVNSPNKGRWRGALMFSLICALNKRLSKQSLGWWFETPSRSIWRHCYDSYIHGHNLVTRTSRHSRDQIMVILWQIKPNLSSGIRWCLALASARPQWCLLWRFWCVCMCVCRVNGGPDLVCVMKACLIRVIRVNCSIRNLGIYQMLRISGTCNVCSSCVLWLDLSPAWVMSVSKWGC